MYRCPRCDKEYRGETPATCEQCKRPLVVNGRYRIGHSIEVSPLWGEDFDATDLKNKQNVVVRELRIRKADAGTQDSKAALAKYRANVERLKRTKFDGEAVLLNAFESEFKNSVCHYMVFNEDAWASLGSDLHDGASDGGSVQTAGDGDLNLDSMDDLDNILGSPPPKSSPPSAKSAQAPASGKKPAAATPAPAKAGPAKSAKDENDEGDEGEKDPQISDDDLAFLEKMLGDVDGGGSANADLPDYLKDVDKPKGAPAPASGKKPGTAMVKAKGDSPPAKTGTKAGGFLTRFTPVQKAAAAGGIAILITILIILLL